MSGGSVTDLPRRALRASRDVRVIEGLVIAVMLAWAGNFIVVKAAVGVVPPVTFALVRFALAAAVLLLLLRWREASMGFSRRDWVTIAVLGFLGFGLYQMLWPTALTLIPAGDAAIIGSVTPLLTAFLAVAAGSDTLTPAKLAGGLLALVGVVVVIAAGSGLTLGSSVVGDLLILASATSWAVYAAFGAPFLRRHSPLKTTAWATTFGAIALIPLGLFQLGDADPGSLGPGVVAAVLYSGLLSAGIANVVVLTGVRLLGPTRITSFQYIIPFAAVVLAYLFLGEPIRLAQLGGGVVIVAGIVIARRERLVPGRVRRLLTAA
jgi:drug/metabolite transporter (DMT)-like permease